MPLFSGLVFHVTSPICTSHPTRILSALVAASLTACGATSGIVPVGPDTYAVSEMRAEALGGGAEAQRAVLAEAAAFCQWQGRSIVLLALQPGGDPRGYYWPTAFDATFQCVPPPPPGVSSHKE